MKMSKPTISNREPIRNSKDLKKEIYHLQATIRMQEDAIKNQVKALPKAAAGKAAQSAIHFLMMKGVPSKVIGLIVNGVGLFVGLQKQKKGVNAAITKGKEFIVYNVLDKITNFIRNRKRAKASAGS